jgi:hypothetical protein
VTIPSSVEIIGLKCFYGCKDLWEMAFELGSRLRQIEDWTFHGTSLREIKIPPQCEVLTGFSLIGVTSVSIDEGNKSFVIDSDLIYSRDGKRLIRYFGKRNRVLIKKSVELISRGCFYGCESLYEVRLASGIELIEIGDYSFYGCKSLCGMGFKWRCRLCGFGTFGCSGCGLKSRVSPSGVEVVGGGCCLNCKSVGRVENESDSDSETFSGSDSDGTGMKSSGLKSVTIPKSVRTIGDNCFSGCESLVDVTLKGKVAFGRSVFDNCPRVRIHK